MKFILLTRGKIAIVDDADYDLLSTYHWQAKPGRNTWYAYGRVYGPGNPLGTVIIMHRMVINAVGPKQIVDHINRNGLDNRRNNLRLATCSQNVNNSPAHWDAFSQIKGVSFDGTSKRRKRWTACIMRQSKRKRLGYYDTKQEAGAAYDRAVVKWEELGILR